MKWKLTKINQGYQMTKIDGNFICCRDLNWFERIIYYFRIYAKKSK